VSTGAPPLGLRCCSQFCRARQALTCNGRIEIQSKFGFTKSRKLEAGMPISLSVQVHLGIPAFVAALAPFPCAYVNSSFQYPHSPSAVTKYVFKLGSYVEHTNTSHRHAVKFCSFKSGQLTSSKLHSHTRSRVSGMWSLHRSHVVLFHTYIRALQTTT